LSHGQEPATEAITEPEQSEEGATISDENRHDGSTDSRDDQNPSDAGEDREIETTPFTEATGEMMRSLGAAQNCDDECQRNKNDLKAQESMADAAWAMFFATLIGTLLTGMGVILVYLNLREARVVSGEAKKSSDAAIEAAASARRSANIQQSAFETLERPYLFIKATHTSLLHHRLPVEPPSLFYAIANYGKTPAILRSISIILEDNPPDLLAPLGVSDDRFEVISQDETIAERQVFVEDAPGDKFYHGNDATLLFLRGSIDYEDANGTLYRDFFCLRGMPGARTFRLEGGPELNRRTVVRRADAQ